MIFNMTEPGNIKRAVIGERVGSIVRPDDEINAKQQMSGRQ
jgi:hypothetical protein